MNKFCQLQRFKAQGRLDCAVEERKKGTAEINFDIDASAYWEILDFCQKSAPDLQVYDDVPHPRNSQILFNHAKSIRSAECSNGMRISREKPNDMIEYMVNGKTSYGQLCEILKLSGGMESILVKVLQARLLRQSDDLDESFVKLNVLHVQLRAYTYVHLSEVVMPMAYQALPAWSFGVLQPSYLIRPLSGLTHTKWLADNNPWAAQEDAMDLDD